LKEVAPDVSGVKSVKTIETAMENARDEVVNGRDLIRRENRFPDMGKE
jgi:hypothetical protein